MTDLRKAAEMALKLLENKRLRADEHIIPIVADELRQALAQPEIPMSPEHLPQYIATNNIKPITEGGGGAGAQPEQSKYSDIVSDGGLDPRNKFDAPPKHERMKSREDEEFEFLEQRIAKLSRTIQDTKQLMDEAVAWRKNVNGVWHYFDKSSPFPIDDLEPLYLRSEK